MDELKRNIREAIAGVLEAPEIDRLLFLRNSQCIDPERAWRTLRELAPKLEVLYEYEGETLRVDGFTDIQLTSVGIALRVANLRCRTGLALDLSHWI